MDFGWWLPIKQLVIAALALGINEQLIWLLLSVPVFSALGAVARQVIGLTGFGLVTPIILAVVLLFGGWPTLVVLFFVLLAVTLFRSAIRRFRIRYISRMAILMSGLSLLLLIFLVGAAGLGFPVVAVDVLVLFLLVVYGEIFVNLQINRSTGAAFMMSVETVALGVIMAVTASLPVVRAFIIGQPDVTVLISLVLIYFSTRYTGLRLIELIRFRRLISG